MTTENTQQAHHQEPDKGRLPDYEALQEMGQGYKTRLMKIGALWKSPKSDYLIGDTVHGKIILKPREALEKMRNEKAQDNAIKQDQGIGY